MKIKKIIALTTITTIAVSGLANAQTVSTSEQQGILQQAMNLFKSGKPDEAKQLLSQNGLKPIQFHKKDKKVRMENKMGSRKAIEEAIVSGNFSLFQQLASSSPLKNINQNTFNLLTPQFQAKKNAEEQIKNILTNAGIQTPEKRFNK